MLHLAQERWRIFRLLCYKAYSGLYIEDKWIRLLVNDNDVAFKARVWFLIVQKLANLPDDGAETAELSVFYPRMASLLNSMETDVILAYIAMADGNDIQVLSRALSFGINAAAFAREMFDDRVADNICSCSNIDEYSVILDVYLKKQNMHGLPHIISKALERVSGDYFIDYRERTMILSRAMLEGQECLEQAQRRLCCKE